ncbi:unnamed protein product [Leuciscus chuanchicus]
MKVLLCQDPVQPSLGSGQDGSSLTRRVEKKGLVTRADGWRPDVFARSLFTHSMAALFQRNDEPVGYNLERWTQEIGRDRETLRISSLSGSISLAKRASPWDSWPNRLDLSHVRSRSWRLSSVRGFKLELMFRGVMRSSVTDLDLDWTVMSSDEGPNITSVSRLKASC